MDQETAANKVFRILDSGNMILPFASQKVKEYLYQLYAIGYNAGLAHHSNKKEVVKLNDYGTEIQTYESLSLAARKSNTSPRNIQRSIKDNIRAGGFHWKYI